MIVRPRIAVEPAVEDLDRGVTYARAAELLGCDVSTIRRMIRKDMIEGWRIATDPKHLGEPRVSLASIRAWRERNRIRPDAAAATAGERPAPPGKRLHAAHREAVARCKALGIG